MAARIQRRSGPTRRPHARATAPGHQAVRYSGDRTEQHADQDRVHTEQDTFRQRTRCGAVSRRYARTTDSALHAHRRPASGTRRVQRLQGIRVRAECDAPGTPAHRAVLAPSTTYRSNAPSPPRPPGGTLPGMILTITRRGSMLLVSMRALGHRGSRNRNRPGPDQDAVHAERHIPRERAEYRPICGRHATTVASARSHQQARLQVPAE